MARDSLSANYDVAAASAQQRLYGEYRARLDEDRRLKQSRRNVIDVRARRVEVEQSAPSASGAARALREAADRRAPAEPAALAEYSDDARLAQANRSRTPIDVAAELARTAFVYERPVDSLEISLKSAPLPRGMFVDLTV